MNTETSTQADRLFDLMWKAAWTTTITQGALADAGFQGAGTRPFIEVFAELTTEQAATIEGWMREDIAAIDGVNPLEIHQRDPEDVDEDNQ